MRTAKARTWLRTLKTPSHCRIFLLVLPTLAMTWGGVGQAEALTEAEVVRLATARAPHALAAREAVSVAQAEEVRASLYPNPALGWDREHLPSAPGEDLVDDLFLTLPIDVSGRRWANTALARADVAKSRATAARTQSAAVAVSLSAFYDALAAARDVAIASGVVARLDEAARVVGRRQEAGTTSGYERARLEVEAELARSVLRQAEARARVARLELAFLLGIDSSKLELRGDLTTTADPRQGPGAASRPSLRLLRSSQEAARDAREAAGWSWIPTLSLSGGLRIDGTNESRYGYVAGASITLPVFSRGQDVRAEASARERLAAAELQAAERNASLDAVRAHQQLVAARGEVARFEEATRDRVELLERAAQSGYREGERSIVELVDAQRARTEVERRRLELQLAAKRAEVALRAAQGEFE